MITIDEYRKLKADDRIPGISSDLSKSNLTFSISDYKKLKAEGKTPWNTDSLNKSIDEVRSYIGSVSDQSQFKGNQWTDDEYNNNRAQAAGMRNRLRALEVYANSIKDKDEGAYRNAMSAHSQLSGALDQVDDWFRSNEGDAFKSNWENYRQADKAQKLNKGIDQMRAGSTAKDQVAALGLDEKELETAYKEQRDYEKQEDLVNRFGGMSYDELLGVINDPKRNAQRIVGEVDQYYKNLHNWENEREQDMELALKTAAERNNLSIEQVREIYNGGKEMHNRATYASDALSNDDTNYIFSRIIESGSAEQLQQLKKDLPSGKYYDKLRNSINLAIEEKKEQRYYLDVKEKFPEIDKLIETKENGDEFYRQGFNEEQDPEGFKEYDKANKLLSVYEKMGVDVDKYKRYKENHKDRLVNDMLQQVVSVAADKHPVLTSLASTPVNMIGSLGDVPKVIRAAFDDDYYYDPKGTASYTASNIRSTVSKKIDNPGWEFLYNTGMSMSDSAIGIAANYIPVVGQFVSSAMFFSSAGVSAANEVVENGGTPEQAAWTMLAHGGAELVFEKISLEKLNALQAAKNVKGAKQIITNILKQSFTESSEEVATTLANTLTDQIINGDLSAFARSKQAYIDDGLSEEEANAKAVTDWWASLGMDAAGGAFSGGVFGALGSTKANLSYRSAMKNTTVTLGGVEMSAKDALKAAPDHFRELAQKLTENEGFDVKQLTEIAKDASEDGKARTIADSMERTIRESGKEKITSADVENLLNALYEENIDAYTTGEHAQSAEAWALADLITDSAQENDLGDNDKAILDKVKNGTVLSEGERQAVENSPKLARKIAGVIIADPEKIKTVDFDEKRSNQEKFKASDNGKTLVNDKEFTGGIEISSVDPRTGTITYDFNYADGTSEQLASDKIRFSTPEEAQLNERAASYNTDQARAFVENYHEGQDVDNYAREWNLYSNYGRLAINLDIEKMNVGGTLTNAQKIEAYQQGLNSRIAHNQAQTIVESVNGVKPYTSQIQGTFTYNVPSSVKLTKAQSQMKGFFRDMAAVTGLNIEIFQSQTDAGGNYIGENGSYDPSTNTLRVDINAGLNHEGQKEAYQYSMLNTVAHELTHVAKQGGKYENLREAVIAALGTTENKFNKLVEEKFDQLRKNKKYAELSDKKLMELADEEVICDSCETMLQGNSDFFEDLYKKDKKLTKSFVDAIKRLVERVKSFVTNRYANTEYGKALLQVADDLYSQIQQLWNEAVESGLEASNAQKAEKNKIKYSDRITQSDTDYLSAVERGDMETAQKMVDEAAGKAFPDSKARGEDGKLLKLYHGTKADFNVFDIIGHGGETGTGEGLGINLTDRKDVASAYGGRVIESYVNAKRLAKTWEKTIKKSELVKLIKKTAEAEAKQLVADDEYDSVSEALLDSWISNYVNTYEYYSINDAYKAVADAVLQYNENDRDIIWEVINGSGASYSNKQWVDFYNNVLTPTLGIDGFWTKWDTKDGKSADVIIAFDSSQVKSADPVTYDDDGKVIPLSERFKTDNADIRYQDRNLIAVHNLSEEKLLKSLKLGGFPMPSIAVTKHDSQHTGFGDISLIFGKDTINPDVNSENKVYGGDAWTPMYPTVEYEADSRKSARLYERAREAVKDGEIEFFNPVSLHPDNIEDRLNRSKGEAGLKADLKKDYGFKNLFLKETTGESVSLKKKESKTVLSQDDIEEYSFIYDQMPEAFDALHDMSGKEWLAKYGEAFRTAREEYIKQFFPDISEEQLDNAIGYEKGFKIAQRARKILDFHENGAETITVQNDIEGTHAEIDSKIDEKAYDKWLDEMLAGIEKNAGIQNGVDPYYSNGNRRSFSATHYAETLGNVVKAMKAQRNGESFFAATGIFGVAAKNYGTFESMKADTDRLQSLTDEEYDRIKESFGERFAEIAGNIAENGKQLDDNPYMNMDICYQNILDGVRESKTKSGLVRYLKKIYGNVIDDSVATDILDLIADVGNMPAKYFEAKPQRAIGLGEVKAAVVPSDTSEEVKAALKNAGIPVHEYEKGNEASRSEATQKAINTEYTNAKGETQSDLRFQDRDYSVEPEEYGDLFDDLFTDDGDLSFGEGVDPRRAESIIDKMIEYDAENAAYFLSYSAGEIAQNTLNGLKDIELSDSSYLKIAKRFYKESTIRMNINSEEIAEQVKLFVGLYDDGMFDSFDSFLSQIVRWNEQNVRSDRFASPENMLANAYNLISLIAEEKASYANNVGEMSEKYAKMERASNKAKAEVKQLKAENQELNRSLSGQEDLTDYYRKETYNSRKEISNLQMLNRQLEKAMAKAEEQAERRIERTVERYSKKLDKQKLKASEQKQAALDRMRERYEKLLTAEKTKAKDQRRADHDKVVERYEKKITELKEKAKQQKRDIREDRDTKLIAAKDKRQADLKALRDNRDKKEYVRKIKKVASELQQWALHPTDKHFVPQEFLRSGFYQAVNDITEALIISDNTQIAAKLRKIAAGVMKLQGEAEFKYDIDPVIAAEMNDLADAIGDKKINRDLTLRQAEDIYRALRTIKDSVVNARKLIFEGETKDVVEAGVEIINEQKQINPALFNRSLNNVKKFFLTPERVHNIINGYNEGSTLDRVFQGVKQGIRKKNNFFMDANKMFDTYRDAHVKELDQTQHKVRDIKWTDNAGHKRTTKMTGMQAMQLVMTWNREAADSRLAHMKKGGVSILGAEALAKGNLKKAYENRETVLGINESFITNVQNSLTEFERGYIDIAEQFFNGMAKDAINEVSMILRHFETATSEYYIPIKVDDAEIVKEIEGVKQDSSIENMGMLKSVVPYSDKSVLIQGLDNVINKHIDNVGNYYGLAIPIRNMNKVLNVSDTVRDSDGSVVSRNSVKKSLEKNWGKLGTDIYEQLLIDLQNSRAPSNERMQGINNLVRKIRSNFVTAMLNGNISVTIKQAASYSTAGVYLDQTSLMKGSADMIKFLKPGNLQALFDEIDSHTAQHYIRRKGLSSNEIADIQQSWLKTSKLGRNINNSKLMQKMPAGVNPTNWIQEMDCMTTAALWCATKEQVNKQYKKAGKQIDTDEYWQDVTNLYDKVIEDTQPMYDAMHRPEILKSSSELIKSVFMFKTQPLQNAGIIYDAVGRVMQDKKDKAAWKQLRKGIMSQGKSLLVFAGMSLFAAFVLHRMDRYRDEDDEVTAQSIWDTFIKDVIQNGAGVVLPFGGNEGAGAIINTIDTGKLDFSSVMKDNVAETVTGFFGAGADLVNTINEQLGSDYPDTNKIATAAEKFTITWVSDIFGVPVKNAKNIIKGGVDWAEDIADGGGIFKPDVSDMKAKQIIHSYQKHFENGETDTANSRIQEFYDLKLQSAKDKGKDNPEKEARNAVRDAFTDYYKKIYQKAFKENNTAELERIRKILVSQSKYMVWGQKNTPLSEKLREWQKEASKEK